MDRTDLTLIIGSALVVAVIIGWTLRWFFDRMNTTGPMASDEVVARMREAEEAQTAAEAMPRRLQKTRDVQKISFTPNLMPQ